MPFFFFFSVCLLFKQIMPFKKYTATILGQNSSGKSQFMSIWNNLESELLEVLTWAKYNVFFAAVQVGVVLQLGHWAHLQLLLAAEMLLWPRSGSNRICADAVGKLRHTGNRRETLQHDREIWGFPLGIQWAKSSGNIIWKKSRQDVRR